MLISIQLEAIKVDFDITSVKTIIQLLAIVATLIAIYYYKVTRDKNKTLVELYKLADKDDVGQLIERSKSIVHVPDTLTVNQQFKIVKEQIDKKHKQYILQVTVVIIFIVLFFLTAILLLFKWPGQKETSSIFKSVRFTKEVPKVVGIYPKDTFGPDQKKGLHAGLRNADLAFKVIDLDFLSTSQMKTGDIQPLLDTLQQLIRSENVIAIVGPSVTECTDDILELMLQLKSKIPIFITSAASQDFLKWKKFSNNVHLFRTGSGIDQRADLIANFLKETDITRNSLFLIEDNKEHKTFGRMYYEQLVNRSDILSNAIAYRHIDTFYYNLEDFPRMYKYLNKEISKYECIFILGVGECFTRIIDSFYVPFRYKGKLPKIGGWMNAYSLNNRLGKPETQLYNNKIFEITDINLHRALNYDVSPDKHIRNFEKFIGHRLNPGARDIGIAYDAAICISETYQAISDSLERKGTDDFLKLDNKTLNIFAALMKSIPFEGVLSKVRFTNEGINENISMDCAYYDSTVNQWQRMDIQKLLKL
ncbi:hypothetical protein AAHN97_12530 [Chitinophaga niabensis]|uniref:ABC transporter substrate-binding protein n=1 Tax=Chitinophaga niabensis TaxID=536979 RepID=UPI0031BB130D